MNFSAIAVNGRRSEPSGAGERSTLKSAKRVQQRELVRRHELAFVEQALELTQEGELVDARSLAAGLPVARLLRQHPAHAAARIGHVAGIAWDDVDVQVHDGLAGGRAVVEADVVAGGAVALVDHGADERALGLVDHASRADARTRAFSAGGQQR